MKKWEDIVREKMEEPAGDLPESFFADFLARRGKVAPVPTAVHTPLVWVIIPAVALGLAALLILRKPFVPDAEIQVIQQHQPAPVVVFADSIELDDTIPEATKGHPATIKTIRQMASLTQTETAVVVIDSTDVPDDATPEETPAALETQDSITTQADDSLVSKTIEIVPEKSFSPMISSGTFSKPAKIMVASASGAFAGGGLLAFVANLGSSAGISDTSPGKVSANEEPEQPAPKDVLTGKNTHYFPFRIGLSVRMPLNDRLKLTGGLEYSAYTSKIGYSLSGEKKQVARYLGIPLRLDYTIASGRWLDVYVGGGVEGEHLIGATIYEGYEFSLLGAGGVQLKLNDTFGLYLEPELSWMVPSEHSALETYRSVHPLMFSVTGGIRIDINP